MTKDNKFKEPVKHKTLYDVSKVELQIMWSAIEAPDDSGGKKPSNFRDIESLFDVITEHGEEKDGQGYEFNNNLDSMTLTLSDFDKLIKKLDRPIFSSTYIQRKAHILIERWNNCESYTNEHITTAEV